MSSHVSCRTLDQELDPSAPDEQDLGYEPPMLADRGLIRKVVLGNSSSGNGDANSQYYW